jgi:hypothetical protein
MAWYVLLRPLRPELDVQDPFQICGSLCQNRKTPTKPFHDQVLYKSIESKLVILEVAYVI